MVRKTHRPKEQSQIAVIGGAGWRVQASAEGLLAPHLKRFRGKNKVFHRQQTRSKTQRLCLLTCLGTWHPLVAMCGLHEDAPAPPRITDSLSSPGHIKITLSRFFFH